MSKARRSSQDSEEDNPLKLAESNSLRMGKDGMGSISLVCKVLEETILQKGAEVLFDKYL